MSDDSPSDKPKTGAESPTTAREMDFDDEPQDAGTTTPSKGSKTTSPKPRVSFVEPEPETEETAPAKPPRPLSPQAQAENTLIEAFPDTDVKVIKAVLMASGGRVEPAFNALLGMSDPDFKPEEAPPPRPPRPTAAQRQLEADELYARQLAEHYQSSGRSQRSQRSQPSQRSHQSHVDDDDDDDDDYYEDERGPPLPSRPGMREDERERSFFDDDLPVIKENIQKGFLETQSKVNKWITDFRKRIDGDDDDPLNGPPRVTSPPPPPRRQNYGASQSEQMYHIRKSSEMGRKSTDRDRYDADPHVLGDDFTALELRDDEARPLSNPSLYKPNVTAPQSGPVDEVDAADRKTQKQSPGGSATKATKWQPLTSIAPNPESEENDPFSLGDSEDERELKESKSKDIKEADSARLKEAARNSISEGSGEASKETKASEKDGTVGTKDKIAEEILTGNKS